MSNTGSGALAIGQYDYVWYHDLADAYRPYVIRCPVVAHRIAQLVERHLSGVRIEPIGGAAVPGCPGERVVEVMLLDAADQIGTLPRAVHGLGSDSTLAAIRFRRTAPSWSRRRCMVATRFAFTPTSSPLTIRSWKGSGAFATLSGPTRRWWSRTLGASAMSSPRVPSTAPLTIVVMRHSCGWS